MCGIAEFQKHINKFYIFAASIQNKNNLTERS